MLGNVIGRWRPVALGSPSGLGPATAVKADTFHHEFMELPWRTLLTISTEVRHFDRYPSSETDPAAPRRPANVVGDVIIEFTRDGRIVNQWRLLDILDPYRIGYDSLSGFWNKIYGIETFDW